MGGKQRKKEISKSFKIFLTTWAFVENGLFSGLRAGWPAMVYILKQERIYASLCDTDSAGNFSTIPTTVSSNTTGPSTPSNTPKVNHTGWTSGCNEQDAVFNQCFTVASATMALSALLYGQLNYKYGIRVPRLLSVVIFVGGACCFAFINEELPWLVFPGLLLVSSGGMALYITNNQISYMFTTGSAAVVGLLCGALEASAFVQTIIKMLYENGISLFISFLALASLYSMTLISTIFFLPKDFVKSEITDDTSSNTATVADTDSARDQKAGPKERRTDSVIVDTPGDTNNVFSGKRNGESTLPGNIANAVDNDSDLSNMASQYGAIIIGEKTEYISTDGADSTGKMVDVDNQRFYDTRDSEKELSAVATDTSQDESHEHIQNAQDINQKFLPKNKSEIKDTDKEGESAKLNSQAGVSKLSTEKTLLKCLLTKTFFLYLFWAAAVQIILSMGLGTFNPWLEYVTNKDTNKVSEFTDVLFYSMLGSPILALGFGLAMDALKKPKSGDDTIAANVRTLHTATVSLGLTSLLGVLVCGFFMICANDIIIITSIALVLFRTGLYSCGTAFLRIMYPTNYFGILCGIMSVLSGGISYVQYPLFLWVQGRNQAWLEVFGFLGIIGLVSLVHPAYLYWKSRLLRKDSYSFMRDDTVNERLNVGSADIQEAA